MRPDKALPREETVPLAYLATVVWLLGSTLYLSMVYFATEYSYRLHLAFGIFCSVMFCLTGLAFVIFGYLFIRELHGKPNDGVTPLIIPTLEKVMKRPIVRDNAEIRRFEISSFAPVVTLFLASWASLAYGVARLDPHPYAHPDQITFWLMLKHYIWQLIDMIPGVDAWKQVHIEDPILETSLWPGILVIIFRLVILLVVISSAARLFGFEKKTTGDG